MTRAYERPSSLEAAIDRLADRPWTIIAGGTDVLPNETSLQAWGQPATDDLLDITANGTFTEDLAEMGLISNDSGIADLVGGVVSSVGSLLGMGLTVTFFLIFIIFFLTFVVLT